MDKWLNHPNSLKVISIVIALLIWAVVHMDPETSPQTVTSNTDTKVIEAATIVPVGLDTDKYMLTAMEPTVARIVVEGRISSLLAANLEDYVVQLDLSNVGPGIQELPLTVQMPKGIQEVDLSPKYVTVQIEEFETKTLEVQVLTEGEPASGYVVRESTILGDTGNVVQVTMPKDDYARLGTVAVTMDVDGANSTVTNKKAKVVVYDTLGQPMSNVTIVPETLSVETKVTLPLKEVPLQLRYTGSLPEGYSLVSIQPMIDKVSIYAESATLEQINMYDGAVLDLSKVKESGEVLVKAEKIDGVSAVSPAEISVQVKIEPTTTQTLNNVPVIISGLDDFLKATISDASNGRINFELKGSSTLLQKIRNSDVKLTAKLEGLTEGTHEVPLELELPPYIQAADPEFKVTIVITNTRPPDVDHMTEDDDVVDLPTANDKDKEQEKDKDKEVDPSPPPSPSDVETSGEEQEKELE